MPSLGCFRHSSGELTVVITGAAAAPRVLLEGGGPGATLRPATIHEFGSLTATITNGRRTPGCWWGELPIDRNATRTSLVAEIDGTVHRAKISWPVPPAPPRPPARTAKPRRSRRAAVA